MEYIDQDYEAVADDVTADKAFDFAPSAETERLLRRLGGMAERSGPDTPFVKHGCA